MNDIVIKAEALGKKYTIGHEEQNERYLALRDVLMKNARSFWHKTKDMIQGKPIIQGDTMEEVWALKEASFEIQRGEAVGVIGRNGAGKSTLLKVLSRITEPSAGRVTIKGRVASLLEVGTGFHPELTGRENIYLNGAILGMTRAEIKRKFDEIVAFAEIEKYLDTPVKRYSSGMYMRLAFAVAAHLESEILLVDEVLAVGDAQFQKKCLGKMGHVVKEGRTVLFVSHNMGAIRSLCARAIMFNQGQIKLDANVSLTVEQYLSFGQETWTTGEIEWSDQEAPACDEIYLKSIRLLDPEKRVQSIYDATKSVDIEVRFQVKKAIRGMRIIISLSTIEGVVAFASTNHSSLGEKELLPGGLYTSVCRIPPDLLNSCMYVVSIHIGIPGVKVLLQGKEYLTLMVEAASGHGSCFSEKWPGVLAPALQWSMEEY